MEKPVSLIIGLGQTVGEAIARRFLDAGHTVLAVDPDEKQLSELEKLLGDKVDLHHGDVHTKIGLKNALALCLESYGRIDNVVAVPTLPEPDNLFDLDTKGFQNKLTTVIRASVNALRIFSDQMIEQIQDPENAADRTRQAGTFTFVLSLGAVASQPGWFSEGVTQKAILGVVKSASVELAPEHVRVNAVVALRPRAEGREPWLKLRTPIRRPASAEEIAETALFLSNPASNIITGEAITLDGGRVQLSGLLESED